MNIKFFRIILITEQLTEMFYKKIQDLKTKVKITFMKKSQL